jgi:hypothetical protein
LKTKKTLFLKIVQPNYYDGITGSDTFHLRSYKC